MEPVLKGFKRHPDQPKQCIFCGSRPLTREHLFSDWISKLTPHVGARYLSHRYSNVTATEDSVHFDNLPMRAEGDVLSKKLKVVCRGCNGGWMNDIEMAAKPLLTPLILGTPRALYTEQKMVIATWATLKTIVGETDDHPYAAISRESIQMFHATKRPLPNWRIWIGQHIEAHPTRYTHFGASVFDLKPIEHGVVPPHGHKLQASTFSVGQLCIHTFFCGKKQMRHPLEMLIKEMLAPVYPGGAQPLHWPRNRRLTRQDADMVSHGLSVMFSTNFKP